MRSSMSRALALPFSELSNPGAAPQARNEGRAVGAEPAPTENQ